MKCLDDVIAAQKKCENSKCRYYINFEKDLNCTFISIDASLSGKLKLGEIGERLKLSPARIKQIEDEAIKKVLKRSIKLKILE